MEHLPTGTHYLIDLFDCNAEKLNDIKYIKETLLKVAKLAGTEVLHEYFYQFDPIGITGSVVISESHINIHTWPEHGYAALDAFTCGDSKLPQKAQDYLSQCLESKKVKTTKHLRGNPKK